MSTNNWESGSFKLSVAEWAKFRKAFREGWNRIQDEGLRAATQHWERYKSGDLPKWWSQNSITENERAERFEAEKQRFDFLWRKWKPQTETQAWEPRSRPRKPIRKDFPLATNKQQDFRGKYAYVGFGDPRTVHYESGENNHAVETARESEVGKLFFRLLARVKWTRGTGGQLNGNDEYNKEGTAEGQGGNYVTLRYPETPPPSLERLFNL